MRLSDLKRDIKINKTVYIMLIPIILYFIIFNYLPMAGLVMAFQKFNPRMGVFMSPWVGLDNFMEFFGSYYFVRLLRNTFLISFYDLIFSFPAAIIFALLLNEINNKFFKKFVQTVSYLPYFVSLVVVAGIIIDFTSTSGAITSIVHFLGGPKDNLLSDPKYFKTIFVASNIWQGLGYGSIIYLAALTSVNQELYESSSLDGAGRLRQTWHISLPGIAPTIIIMLILRVGMLFNVGFEKIILLYNPLTYESADVISSFVFRKGLLEFSYGYSTAIGLFNSVLAFILIILSNKLAKRYTETSLF